MGNELTQEEKMILAALRDPDAAPKEVHYDFDKNIQQDILSLMINERSFMVQAMNLIRHEYFVDKAHVLICKILMRWFEAHVKNVTGNDNRWIEDKYIRDGMSQELKDNPAKPYYMAELQSILDCYVQNLTNSSYCMERITNFAKDQEIRLAISRTIDILKNRGGDKYDRIKNMWDKAFLVGPQMDLGLNYFEDIEARYERMLEDRNGKSRFSSGFADIDEGIVGGGLSRGEIGGYEAMSGAGKCFEKDTQVLMYDGTIKMVQDVVVGDLVMGNDSKPRTVLSLHRGESMMYKVTPVKGDPYVVNEEHILSLKTKHPAFKNHPKKNSEGIFNISVKDYLKENKSFKDCMKGWRTGVNFQIRPIHIDPYMLGVWLGDGNQDTSAVTTSDKEIVDLLREESEYRDLKMSACTKPESPTCSTYYLYGKGYDNGCNSFVNDLRRYNLLYNKHIPFEYKSNSRKVRLELLAGILDTDGSMSHNMYDFINKNKTLAEDVVFLARSLGFAAYMKKSRKRCCNNGVWGDYWRVSISGDCSQIPVRLPHKKAGPRRQIKDHLVHGIKVEEHGVGEYYGFSTDGNHLFLLGDFTVVHNSWMLCKSAIDNVKLGHKVLLVTLEMNQDKTAERFDTLFTGVNMNNLLSQKDYVKRKLNAEIRTALSNLEAIIGEDKRRLMIKHFSAGTADVNTIRAYYSQLSLHGFKPDMLIVDYIGEFKDFPNMKTHESRQKMMRDLRAFGVDEQHCTLTALQANRSGRFAQDGGFIDDSEIGDSYGQVRNMDACWSINQTKKEKKANVGRIFVVKNRNGKSRYHFYYRQDPVKLQIEKITEDQWKDEVSAVKDIKEEESFMANIDDASKFTPNGGNRGE